MIHSSCHLFNFLHICFCLINSFMRNIVILVVCVCVVVVVVVVVVILIAY